MGPMGTPWLLSCAFQHQDPCRARTRFGFQQVCKSQASGNQFVHSCASPLSGVCMYGCMCPHGQRSKPCRLQTVRKQLQLSADNICSSSKSSGRFWVSSLNCISMGDSQKLICKDPPGVMKIGVLAIIIQTILEPALPLHIADGAGLLQPTLLQLAPEPPWCCDTGCLCLLCSC